MLENELLIDDEKEKRTVEFHSYDTIFTYYIDELIKSNQ